MKKYVVKSYRVGDPSFVCSLEPYEGEIGVGVSDDVSNALIFDEQLSCQFFAAFLNLQCEYKYVCTEINI